MKTKTSVSADSSKPNLKYFVILSAVCLGATGKIMGRNARFHEEEKKRKKSGRQSSLGHPSKVHPALFIIASHYIIFKTVNVCKSRGVYSSG